MPYIMATFHSVEKLSRPSSFFLTVLLAFQLVYPTDGSENTPSLLGMCIVVAVWSPVCSLQMQDVQSDIG